MTQLRSVWHNLLRTEVQEKHIPVPSLGQRVLDDLTVEELQKCVFRAHRLRQNWSSADPVTSRKLEIVAVREPESRIISLNFLPGRGHRWLLSVTLTTGESRHFTIQCWDLHATPPTCVARRSISRLSSLQVNSDPSHSAILAVQCPSYAHFAMPIFGC